MRPRSLRFKLGWNHGLIISIVFVMIGMMRYVIVSYRAHANFDKDLLTDARLLLSYLDVKADGLEWRKWDALEDTLPLESLKEFFVVTDSTGQVVQSSGIRGPMRRIVDDPGVRRVLDMDYGFGDAQPADGTYLRFVSLPVPVSGSGPKLVAHLGRSSEPVRLVLKEYFFIWAFSAPIVLVASVILGWYLAGRALRPFEEVSRTAMQITSKNLNTQIVTERQEEEIQRLVQSFNAMVSRLDRSFRQIRDFNADVAHELRTPLSVLQGENEIALRDGTLPEAARALIGSNLEELERLRRLVNDLFTLAEADAGVQIMVRKPVPLRPVLQDLVEQMQVLALERDIRIELEEMPEVTVEADEVWMRRAFLNLIDNSIKYSSEGTRITMKGGLETGRVFVEISDEGRGIPPADLPFVFDRLFRGESARSSAIPGRGLGLALVKWIVEAHEGGIRVRSQPGRGSVFRVTLPLPVVEHPNEGDILRP